MPMWPATQRTGRVPFALFSESMILSAKKKPTPESRYMSGTISMAFCSPIFSSSPATAAAKGENEIQHNCHDGSQC